MIEQVFEIARAKGARVVLPEIDDPRMRSAVDRIEADGLAEIVPIPKTEPTEAEIAAIFAVRAKATEGTARRMLERPLYRAGAMVATGQVDTMIAGAATPTRRVVEAASMTVGLARPDAIPSSFFLMLMPDGRGFVFADCALNVAPDAAALAQIAVDSAGAARRLLGRSQVAMLSFSTLSSGAGATVDLVREATEAARAMGLAVAGPVQADAALNPVIAEAKGLDGTVANTLVFPSLDAGNIAYKLMQELGGAQAIGPILQGFRKPVCDLSRGATVDDIVTSLAVTVALSGDH
ncbi:MAG: phosphate acetyltransferase [Rhodobacteraceae bacterium]|nr:phosphate acetyltransferase [Paracoccaceae bacterium]